MTRLRCTVRFHAFKTLPTSLHQYVESKTRSNCPTHKKEILTFLPRRQPSRRILQSKILLGHYSWKLNFDACSIINFSFEQIRRVTTVQQSNVKKKKPLQLKTQSIQMWQKSFPAEFSFHRALTQYVVIFKHS